MTDKWAKYLLVALTVSSFGPYLAGGGGVRLEHLVIYAAGGLAGLVFLFRMHRFPLDRQLFVFSTLLMLPLAWITVVSWGLGGSAFGGGSIPVFENFFQAWAIVFLIMFLARYRRLGKHFPAVVKALLICLAVNASVALLQILVSPDLFGILDYFRTAGGDPAEKTVAAKAVSMGRFIGIYNQPLEAGGNYSLGLLGWAWLENNHRNYRSVWRYLLLGLIVIGGLLSVSKVFIFGGMGLFLAYMFVYADPQVRRRFLYALPVFGGLIAWYVSSIQWGGLNYLLRLFRALQGDESLLVRLTAGRFGGDRGWGEGPGPVVKAMNEVMGEAPLHGFGMVTPPVLDNGFVQYLYHGGVVAVGMYVLLLLWLIHKGIRLYRLNGRRYIILLMITALILGLSIGAPAFTLNRFSVNVTLFVCLILLMKSEGGRP